MRTIIFLMAGLFACSILQATPFSRLLDCDWVFKDAAGSLWLPATVPGTVHTDLLKNKRIPDPFYRDNETKVQWVAEKNWDYQTHFNIRKDQLANKHIELVFEGLDTYADVYLNDQLILQADNMFRTWKVNVKPCLKQGRNKLTVR